jgi:hypothetical protein
LPPRNVRYRLHLTSHGFAVGYDTGA